MPYVCWAARGIHSGRLDETLASAAGARNTIESEGYQNVGSRESNARGQSE